MIDDLLRLGWLAGVTALLLWGFGAGRRGVRRDPAARIALIARAIFVIVVAVNILTRLHILNAGALLAACFAWPIARWLKRYNWAAEQAVRTIIRGWVLESVRLAEQPLSSWPIVRTMRGARHRALARARIVRRRVDLWAPGEMALAGAASAGVAVAVYLRFFPVMGESRLGDPRLYAALLHARQALFNAPDGFVSVLSAVSAALGTAASMHTLHVVRLLGPVGGVAIVTVPAALVRRATKSNGAGIIVLAMLAPTTPQFAGDLDVAVLFLLLGGWSLAFRTPASRHGLVACLGVTALAAAGADATAIGPAALPVGLAIAAGATYAALAAMLGRLKSLRIDMAAAPVACAAMVALLPQSPRALFLEYPAAQKKALEMSSTLPRGNWLLVAPLEQLAESYGRGWYEEPYSFVERYAARVADPAFAFDFAVSDVLVLVEKRPFKTYGEEPAALPFSILTDPTYRHYRSLAGRASLQAQLRVLCEAYRRSHDGTSIYYEDDDLTIYRFRLRG